MANWFAISIGASLLVAGVQDCSSPQPTTLSGQVLLQPTCQSGPYAPIDRTRVDVLAGDAVVTYGFTDAEGNYSIEVDPGDYVVRVMPPPDYPVSLPVSVSQGNVTVDTVRAHNVFAPREVIAGFYPDVTEQEVIYIAGESGAVTLDPLFQNTWLIGLSEEEHVTEGIGFLAAWPDEVEYAEPNYIACPMVEG